MDSRQKILIVDDDSSIAELLCLYLTKEFFDCTVAYDGEAALEEYDRIKPDLVLLDLMLPKMDGYQVCRSIREKGSTPIIMLSAKGEVFDKVLGLELGADDYMIKPFDSKELVARVKAVLRRSGAVKAETAADDKTDEECIQYNDLIISLSNYTVFNDGKYIDMPPKELELLYFIAKHPNRVFNRDQLLNNIWGYDYIGDTRTVDVHIKRVRAKLKENDSWNINTVWGIGYKFEVRGE